MNENEMRSDGRNERDIQDRITEHEYDGIREFDNKLPNWWLWILWGSMIFALCYWVFFHTLELGNLPRAAFEIEMLEAREAELARMAESGISNESLVLMSGIPAKLDAGREIFSKHCVTCHLDKGQGKIGPNLTDGFWIHGCEPMQMHDTVVNGVPAKGMPSWMNQLGPSRIQAVTAYVLTLRNTNVSGKAPEGEPCEF